MASQLPRHDVPDGVEPTDWSLRVTGAVERPLELDRADLVAMDLRTVDEEFSCVEGWTAAGLSWRGVELATLLDAAGVEPAASFGLVHAMDGDYACSFPLDRLRDALLAVELDGQPLEVVHGGPTRLVPRATDSDCWESVKWVSRIELRTDAAEKADTAKALALSRIE